MHEVKSYLVRANARWTRADGARAGGMEMNSFVIHAAVVAVVAAGGYGRGDADAHCDVRAPGVRSME